jgi:RNA polymerase sigma-70 factor (ECF subfamily)
MRLHLARWRARLDAQGHLVLLEHQDRARWDRPAIAAAVRLIQRAAERGRPGPYQLQAAIAAVHCEAPSWEATDWPQLLGLYTLLAALDPSPVVRLNGAIALRQIVAGPRLVSASGARPARSAIVSGRSPPERFELRPR